MCIKNKTANRQCLICQLRKMAAKAEGIKASLPNLPVKNWFDGTIQKAEMEVFFEEYDLAKLLQFIADVGLE